MSVPSGRRPRPVLGGAVIVAIGATFLLQVISATAPFVGSLLFAFLGVAFAAAYVLGTRPYAYLLPAGVLLGFGIGLFLVQAFSLPPQVGAPLFLFTLGLGLVAVYLFAPARQWPLVPAAILAIISAVGYFQPALIPEAIRPYIIPAILIGVGAYLLVGRAPAPATR